MLSFGLFGLDTFNLPHEASFDYPFSLTEPYWVQNLPQVAIEGYGLLVNL